MIKLATVGTSSICEKFLKAVKMTERYELAAVYSRTQEKADAFAEHHGAKKTYVDLREMAADPEIDVVYIASPNVFHAKQSVLFLEAGKHVICEKPVTLCTEDYVELKQYADEHNLMYADAIMSQHSPGYKPLHDAVSKIGQITHARIDFSQLSSKLEAYRSGKTISNFSKELGGGVLNDLGVYCIYAAIDLFGVPKKIRCSAKFLPDGVDGEGTAVFEYEDLNAVLTYTKLGKSALGSEIIGDKGTVTVEMISQYAGIKLFTEDGCEEIAPFYDRSIVMRGEADCFADFIEGKVGAKHAYDTVSEKTLNVCKCMDEIKQKTGGK